MPEVHWAEMFAFSMSPLELFIRGTVTYLFLFLIFRSRERSHKAQGNFALGCARQLSRVGTVFCAHADFWSIVEKWLHLEAFFVDFPQMAAIRLKKKNITLTGRRNNAMVL